MIRRRTPERMPAVVFLTAYDQFAIRAFEAEALDYLVKPVSEARFAATIERLTRRLEPAARARARAIVVTTATRRAVLPLREIDWIEAADNYARLARTRSYSCANRSASWSSASSRKASRAHRQALVRLSGVRALRPDEGRRGSRTAPTLMAVFACGTKVPDFTPAARRVCRGPSVVVGPVREAPCSFPIARFSDRPRLRRSAHRSPTFATRAAMSAA